MPTHSEIAPPQEKSERAPCSAAHGGVVASPGACPVCGKPLTGRQQACSGKCRAILSRQQRAEKLAARDRRIQGRLKAALDLVYEACQELERS
ncbi:MAG: DUF2116 family Zn-ribbon domain-containing protein [Candidatus Rokubacteria bacterium]|nr:DUF2116 family Zn-ribbon domain-containing protein [Candidatus Rokubacteria bacterium]